MQSTSKVLDGWGFVTYPQENNVASHNIQNTSHTLEGWGYVTCPKECPSCPCPWMLPPFVPLQKEKLKQKLVIRKNDQKPYEPDTIQIIHRDDKNQMVLMSVEAKRFTDKRSTEVRVPLPKLSPPSDVTQETVLLNLEPQVDLYQSAKSPGKRRHDSSGDKDLNNNISDTTEQRKKKKLSEYKLVLPTYKTSDEPSEDGNPEENFQAYAAEEYNKALRFIQDEDLDELTIETCYAHTKPLLKNPGRTRAMDKEVRQLGQFQRDLLHRCNLIAIKLIDANVPVK